MGAGQLAVLLLDVKHGSRISVATMLQVGLEEQSLHLQAFGLLPGFNLVEGEFEGAAGGQPRLEKSELDTGGSSLGRSRGCGCHNPTVY
jgi:hypothetical protein